MLMMATAQIISSWFLEQGSDFISLKWPPQPKIINPNKHIWDVVAIWEICIKDVQPFNLQQHCDVIMSTLIKLSKKSFKRLVVSVPISM